jgi:ABC-type spermidine/putrescine transport system permease subunit II
MGIMVGFYVILFFVYLFGPLFMMGASAFNQCNGSERSWPTTT